MGVAEVMYAWIESETGCLAGRCPDAAAKPVTRDVLIGVDGLRHARLVPPFRAPPRAVGREGALAMITSALAGGVGAERGMPVLAASVVRLSESEGARISDHPDL